MGIVGEIFLLCWKNPCGVRFKLINIIWQTIGPSKTGNNTI